MCVCLYLKRVREWREFACVCMFVSEESERVERVCRCVYVCILRE